jgi:hypothetical protein
MGGPGSGRRPRAEREAAARADDLGDLGRLSRVELEPMLGRALSIGDTESAEAIRAELASRTWQHTNPYAGPV